MIGEVIYSRITTDSTLTSVGTRVFPDWASLGNSKPLIVYQIKNGEAYRTNSGNTGTRKAEVELHCLTDKHKDCEALQELVFKSFEMKSGIWNGVTIQNCRAITSGVDDFVVAENTTACYIATVFLTITYTG